MNQEQCQKMCDALNESGLTGLDDCPLHRKMPFGMTNLSMTQLSIARHFGGITYNGEHYTYLPTSDELIRDDVLKWKRKQANQSIPAAKQLPLI